MTKDQVKHMVDRFLSWKLPRDTFNPDCGISFDKKPFNTHTPHPMLYEPSGTNLFDAVQADAMVRYMLEGLPPAADNQTFDKYSDLPPEIAKHLAALEDLIGDLDGKTICTETTGPEDTDDRFFTDEGVIVASDYVEHFNGIIAAFRAATKAPG